jgi:hypothetical protein
MQNIHKLADSFYKSAGLFQAPPAMVTRIQKDVISSYSAVVAYNTKHNASAYRIEHQEYSDEADAVIKNYKEIFFEAKKHTKLTPHKKTDFSILYNINLDGWKYLKPDLKKLFSQWKKEDLYDPYIKLAVYFKEHTHRGEYDHRIRKMSIWIDDRFTNPETVDNYILYTSLIKRTVEHELEHFGQFLLGNLLRKRHIYGKMDRGDIAGLPSNKLRSQIHDLYGKPVSSLDTDLQLSHPEQDIEFYPDIKNSIRYFLYHISHIIKEARTEFFKCWIGEPNHFIFMSEQLILQSNPEGDKNYLNYINMIDHIQFPFDILKNKNRAKWEKAVKVFYSAVRHTL